MVRGRAEESFGREIKEREMERTFKKLSHLPLYNMNTCMFEPNIIRSTMAGGKLKKKKKKKKSIEYNFISSNILSRPTFM